MRPNIIHNICINFAIFNICILFSIFYIAIGTDSDIKEKSCWAHRLENAVVLRQVQFFFAELNRKYRELHATNLFLYPFKISDKQTISDVFKGDRRRPVASNGLILTFHIKQRHCVKSVRIRSPYSIEIREIRTRKTSNTDTFHTARQIWIIKFSEYLYQ